MLTHHRDRLLSLSFWLILDSSVALRVGIQSAGDLVSQTSQLRIPHSAEEDNLSAFDSKITCPCRSIKINNKIHYLTAIYAPKVFAWIKKYRSITSFVTKFKFITSEQWKTRKDSEALYRHPVPFARSFLPKSPISEVDPSPENVIIYSERNLVCLDGQTPKLVHTKLISTGGNHVRFSLDFSEKQESQRMVQGNELAWRLKSQEFRNFYDTILD